jgi:cytochrome b561
MTTNSVISDAGEMSPGPVSPKRYHPALVVLHWLITILIFSAFFLAQANEGEGRERFQPGQGNLSPAGRDVPVQLANPPQGVSQGIQNVFSTIGLHMMAGLFVLALLIIRVFVRWRTKHPEWASSGIKFFDWVGNLTHLGLYLLTFAMVITGIFLADRRGILVRTFGIGSTPTPGARRGFSLGMFHEGVWILLILLIALHVGAALYHQFIVKDNLLSRMWFGKDI